MPELEDDLRAIAPRPDEAFLTRLDARVASGFAAPAAERRRRERRRSWLVHRAAPVAACAIALLALVVGITSLPHGGDDSASSSSGGAGSSAAAPTAAPTRRAEAPSTPLSRIVEQRTTIELATPERDFADTTAGVLRVADATGTIVQRSSVADQDGRGYATYDLRVPSSRLEEALAQLSRLGDVRSRTASSDDITAPVVSARARLSDARAQRRALLRALARADSADERASIRRRLAAERRAIARAERDVRRLRTRSDRARVSVTVRSTGERTGGGWTPGDALGDAGRILEVAAGVLLIAGAVVLPPLLVLAALIAALRLTRRRRREAALG